MASFEEALAALKNGKQVKSPFIDKWMHLGTRSKKIIFKSPGWENHLEWHPSQTEILSDNWEIK